MASNTHTPFTDTDYVVPDSPVSRVQSAYLYNEPTQICHDIPEVSAGYRHKDHRHLEQIIQACPDNSSDSDGSSDGRSIEFPNKWAKFRHESIRVQFTVTQTMLLVVFGTGVNCQVILSSNPTISASPKGEYLSISFGWAVGVALGAWVSGGISGGHINPAVTLALATFRGFSWKKVPSYIFAQVLGAFAGAGLVYENYYQAIDLFEGGNGARTVPGTASLFTTFPMDHLSDVQCFFSEILGTAILLLVILAVTDKQNGPPPSGLVPLVLFILMLGQGACLGMQTGYALNPARDLGPRLFCWAAGYGRQVWTYRYQYWLYTPFLGPIVGAILGTVIYDALIFTGSESIFNKPDTVTRRHRSKVPAKVSGKITTSGEDAV